MSDRVEQVADAIMNKIEPPAAPAVVEHGTEIRTVTPAEADVETKKLEKPKEPEKPKLPELVVRAQKLIETIHGRRELRIQLLAMRNRRSVEIENELRQAAKDRDARLEAVESKAREDLAAIAGAFEDLGTERAGELEARDIQLKKLDLSIDQLRKQLDAEISKLAPEPKVTA